MAGMAQLQEIIRLVEQSLDEPGLDAGELARRARSRITRNFE